jgi:tocopherol O-methyltransferase
MKNLPYPGTSGDIFADSNLIGHFPNKALFFRYATLLLNPGGKLIIADWFKAEGLTGQQIDTDIKPIKGMF